MASTVLISRVCAQDTAISTVRVRLLANETISQITLQAYGGLRISAERAKDEVVVTACDNQLDIRDAHGPKIIQPVANLASRAGRWIEIQRPKKAPRRTVGWLQISARNGKLQIINVLPLETYVLGITEAELGSLDFNPESLKAQIVASRSYVLASRWRHRKEGYNFCDTPHCQAFGGTSSIRSNFKLAMQISRGQYLSYKGKPIAAFYHDNCGGITAAVQDVWKCPTVPYLQSVSDTNGTDTFCQSAPRAEWHFEAPGQQLRMCFLRAGWIVGLDALDTLRVIRRNSSHRAHQVLIQSNQPRWVPAKEFRQVINRHFHGEVLKSTFFTISKTKDGYEFNGRGWGHGVGLCQWGAIEMAREGYTYQEILDHYYPGTTLERLPEPAMLAATSQNHSIFN
ncbi:MAG: SpoIID/LytB domain-containing protein [Elusimicrobiota bacterium]